MEVALRGRQEVTQIEVKRPGRPASWWATQCLRYLVLIAFLFIFLTPFLWILSMSFKDKPELIRNPLGPPEEIRIDNYAKAWGQGRYKIYVPNTILYSLTIVAGVCTLSCLAGYGFAKLRFPGRDALFNVMLLGITLPFLSVMIPVFYLARDLGILGTIWGFIIPGIGVGLPFGAFLMRAFFLNVPDDLSDAGRVDGCNEWIIFLRIVLPLAGPGLTTLAVFQFLFTWTAFIMPLILVQRDALRPVALALPLFTGRYSADLPLIAAGTMITIAPVIGMYMLLQRKFVEGVTAGALK